MPHPDPALGNHVPERTMGAEELFFSTTDARGVIRQGNSVFARISGYSLEEMAGAPHNMVRHPQMPGGVFRLMWDTLQAGRPMGAYVCNRARDGAPYWVFAVISPLHDGFVSVRLPPRGEAIEAVRQVYAEATAVEQQALTMRGMSRRDAAELGAETIVAALARRGFASYEEFLHQVLPAEIAARTNLVTTAYARPAATGPIAGVLAGTRAVDDVLERLVGRLAGYGELGDELASTALQVSDMGHRLEGSVAIAQQASLSPGSKPVLANLARVMAQPMTDAVEALDRLPADFVRLREDIARLRFQISLARLYNDMAAGFAAEVHDGAAPAESLSAVPLLCDAVEICVVEMSAQVEQVNADLHEVSALVGRAAGLLDDFRRFIGQWRMLAQRHARVAMGDLVQPIDAEIYASWSWIEQLRDLGRQAGAAIVPFDPTRVRSHLDTMRPRRQSA